MNHHLKVFIILPLFSLAGCGQGRQSAPDLEVENWGPQTTRVGKAFWPQGTKEPGKAAGSVIWVKFAGDPRPAQTYELKFGSTTVTNTGNQGNMLVFSVPPEAYAVAGSKKLVLTEIGSGVFAEFGPFIVKEPIE